MRLSWKKKLGETKRWFVTPHRSCVHMHAYDVWEKRKFKALHHEVWANLSPPFPPTTHHGILCSPWYFSSPYLLSHHNPECPLLRSPFCILVSLMVQPKLHEFSLALPDKPTTASSPSSALLQSLSFSQWKKSQQYKVKQKFLHKYFSWRLLLSLPAGAFLSVC